jgi:hypothetical protein
MRMDICCYFYISDYVAGNIDVRRSLASSWCMGSSNSKKNEEVSVDLEEGNLKACNRTLTNFGTSVAS